MNLGLAVTSFPVFSALVLALGWSAPADAAFDLGLNTTDYLGQSTEGRDKAFTSLSMQIDARTDTSVIDSRLWAQGTIGLNNSQYSFLELPEAYLATDKKFSGDFTFAFGRKIEPWSGIDTNWRLGVWDPNFRWDYLRPQEVGMLGASAAYQSDGFRGLLFASPFFIPDRDAPIDFAGGRINSISPWVLNPPDQVQIANGKNANIDYSASIPSTLSVVMHPTISALFAYDKGIGTFASAGYAYKPMNQLLISYQASYNNATGNVDAILYPRVAYQQLISTDVGYRTNHLESTLSLLADLPDDTPPNVTQQTSQQVANAYLVSPTFTYYFIDSRKKSEGYTSLSYLKKVGVDPADVGVDADGSSTFDSRYPYSSAMLAKLAPPMWRSVGGEVDVLYDISQPGTIISWIVFYSPEKSWKVYGGADVLTSWSTDSTSFIYRYRANDRMMGGVTHAF